MSDSPVVSVIVPTYNSAGFVGKCISSFQKQTFKDFEVIFVDDCSSDETIAVISGISASAGIDVSIFSNPVNSGPAAARKLGVDKSRGKYVCFCDSDDWYREDYLELMYQGAVSTGSDLIICGFTSVIEKKDSGVTQAEKRIIDNPTELSVAEALLLNVDSMCNILAEKQLLLDVPVPNIRNGEDMAMIPQIISKASGIYVLDECPYYYYYRAGSAAMTPSLKVVESLRASFEIIMDSLGQSYPNECEYIGIRNVLYGVLLNLFKYEFNPTYAKTIVSSFEANYSNWRKSKYISRLPLFKRLFVLSVAMGNYPAVYLLAKFHEKVTG